MSAEAIDILLIEDDRDHAELILAAFEARGDWAELTVATSIREARTCLDASLPDLIIADWFLPDGKCSELLAGREEWWKLPVIVITSHGTDEVAIEAAKMGAVDYAIKSEAVLADMPHIAQRALDQWNNIAKRKRAEDALPDSEE